MREDRILASGSKARHSVVLLKRFKDRVSERRTEFKVPCLSQSVRLPAVLSGDAGKTFLINTHERQIEDEHNERMRQRNKKKKAERESTEDLEREKDRSRQNEE